MALPMPILLKPPWYSTSTAIASLPTAVPISCNSLIESPTDTPATEIRKNESYDNIENDRPDDDDDDDVDCFPRQDKQPVLPQDISPTVPTAHQHGTRRVIRSREARRESVAVESTRGVHCYARYCYLQ